MAKDFNLSYSIRLSTALCVAANALEGCGARDPREEFASLFEGCWESLGENADMCFKNGDTSGSGSVTIGERDARKREATYPDTMKIQSESGSPLIYELRDINENVQMLVEIDEEGAKMEDCYIKVDRSEEVSDETYDPY